MSTEKKQNLIQGSLEMLILQSLRSEPRHGYSIVRYLKNASSDVLQVEEGTLYPALHRMEQRGLIVSWWGASESNRRARFYELTAEGQKHLRTETDSWKTMSLAINTVLGFQT